MCVYLVLTISEFLHITNFFLNNPGVQIDYLYTIVMYIMISVCVCVYAYMHAYVYANCKNTHGYIHIHACMHTITIIIMCA